MSARRIKPDPTGSTAPRRFQAAGGQRLSHPWPSLAHSPGALPAGRGARQLAQGSVHAPQAMRQLPTLFCEHRGVLQVPGRGQRTPHLSVIGPSVDQMDPMAGLRIRGEGPLHETHLQPSRR